VTPEIAPRDTDVPDHTYEAATRNKDSVDMSPDLLQLNEECFVILYVSQLVRVLVVALQIPIRRRG
jgi:hypothetical protein